MALRTQWGPRFTFKKVCAGAAGAFLREMLYGGEMRGQDGGGEMRGRDGGGEMRGRDGGGESVWDVGDVFEMMPLWAAARQRRRV